MPTYQGVNIAQSAPAGIGTGGAKSVGYVVSKEDRQKILDCARKGNAEVNVTPTMQAARALIPDGLFRFGFDVAIGLCKGMSLPGPGQTAICNKLGRLSTILLPDGTYVAGSDLAKQGFNMGQAMQHGITKARSDASLQGVESAPPGVAAGMLVTAGLADSGSSVQTKVQTMEIIASNGSTAAGAQQVITAKKGLWARFCAFFGF